MRYYENGKIRDQINNGWSEDVLRYVGIAFHRAYIFWGAFEGVNEGPDKVK